MTGDGSRSALSTVARAAIAVLATLAGAAAPAGAQAVSPRPDTPVGVAAEGSPPAAADAPAAAAYPGGYRIVPELLTLDDDAAEARQVLDAAAEPRPPASALAEAARRQQRLSAILEGIRTQSYPRLDSLLAIRERALSQKAAVERMIDTVSERLERLDELRQSWQSRRRYWSGWRESLRGDPQFATFADGLARGLGKIDEVVAAAEAAVEPPLERQRALQHLQRQLLDLQGEVDDLLAARRQRLLEIDSPPLLSADHRAQLAASWGEIGPGIARAPGVDRDFLREHAWLIALQLALLLAVGLVARRFRDLGRGDGRWPVLLGHPWAIGAFVAVALLSIAFAPAPPLWELGQWLVLGGSTALLASGMFRLKAKRQVVYALVAFYLAYHAATLVAYPDSQLRLGLAGTCLVGILWLLALARANRRSGDHRPGFVLALRAGAVALAVVFVAQLVGYNTVSQWLLESALATAFLGFAAVFLIRLGRGAIRALVEAGARFEVLASAGSVLAERLVRIFEVAVMVWAALYALAIWEVFDGPWQGWRILLAWGFTIGDYRVTLGRLLLAVTAIYAAMLVSWLVRTLLEEEWVERRELDRGVADSIKTLLHYLVIVAGFFLALSLAGFDLRNFAIVVGALGVGIGFGLQNVVNNFVSGLILLFERPVRAGDVVVLGDVWGKIDRIGLRSTLVTTFDQSELIVPNSDLISEKVVNWTLSNRRARILIAVGVAYGSDLEAVLHTLLEVASAHPEVLGEPAPSCVFANFGDSSLDFELRVWVGDIDSRLKVRSELLGEIDRRFRAAGIEIPFPQRDLHLRSVEPGVEWRPAGETKGSAST